MQYNTTLIPLHYIVIIYIPLNPIESQYITYYTLILYTIDAYYTTYYYILTYMLPLIILHLIP